MLAFNEVQSNGKTVRENNLDIEHAIPVGTLVEVLSDGDNPTAMLRVFVVEHTRDCDGTPLYSLHHQVDIMQHIDDLKEAVDAAYLAGMRATFLTGMSEDMLRIIKHAAPSRDGDDDNFRQFMTNVDPFPGIEDAVRQAAETTGLRVKYHPYPMPLDPYDSENFDLETGQQIYFPERCTGGSISTLDYGKDHSAFWDLFNLARGRK